MELEVCSFPWFDKLEGSSLLEQGMIVEKCKILVPDENGYNALSDEPSSEEIQNMGYIEGDFVIMSQSCDLTNDKIDSVILCPIVSLQKVAKIEPTLNLKSSKQREALRQGNIPSYHLLNALELLATPDEDYYCVSFKHIYSVPKDYLKKVMENRTHIRLLSPYKEHLSQSFARYFMRVGLPTDIPKTKVKEYSIAL